MLKPSSLQIKAALQIQKPGHEVFEAIADPEQMRHYFISESTGRIEEGKQLVWRFPEFDVDVPVRIATIIQDKFISYYWPVNETETLVEITLSPFDQQFTVVTVTEKEMNNNEAGIRWLQGNTEGWANFLACLKAWLEYGIHLRKNAFDFRS